MSYGNDPNVRIVFDTNKNLIELNNLTCIFLSILLLFFVFEISVLKYYITKQRNTILLTNGFYLLFVLFLLMYADTYP